MIVHVKYTRLFLKINKLSNERSNLYQLERERERERERGERGERERERERERRD
jgi:hypothetical protein